MLNNKTSNRAIPLLLILASASRSRRAMLENAGISCSFKTANIDEGAIKKRLLLDKAHPHEISENLAVSKAMVISQHYPDHVILGADQLLMCDDRLFDKPDDMIMAATHLRALRGKSHCLYTSYALIKNQTVILQETVVPRLTMRNFSEDFLQDYLEQSGEKILSSVGCYLMEDLGPQLFSEISGDYFSILGLPLLNLMDNLRKLNMMPL